MSSDRIPASIEPGRNGAYRVVGELSFDTVVQLLEKSESLFGELPTVEIDLQAASPKGSVGLALLLEWLRRGRQRKQAIRFVNIPKTLLDIADVSNVSGLLFGGR